MKNDYDDDNNYKAYKQLGFEFFQEALDAAGDDSDKRFQIMDKMIPVISAFAEMMAMAYEDAEYIKETFPHFDGDEFLYLLGKLLLQEYIEIDDMDFVENGSSVSKDIADRLGIDFLSEEDREQGFNIDIYTFKNEEDMKNFLNNLAKGEATMSDLDNANLKKQYSADEVSKIAQELPEGENLINYLLKKSKETEKADNEMIKGAIKHIADIKKEQLRLSDGLNEKLQPILGEELYTDEEKELIDEVNHEVAEDFLRKLFGSDKK